MEKFGGHKRQTNCLEDQCLMRLTKKEITYQNAKNIRNTPNKSALMYQPITNY
jgi:hypothetical protein